MAKKEASSEDTIQYLIKQRTEEFVIELPRAWKVTFATVNPASNMGRTDGYCVRVYEMPGNHLRAVFDSVISLRDMSIPLARKVKEEIGHSQWTKDSTGNFSGNESRRVSERFEQLTSNTDDTF